MSRYTKQHYEDVARILFEHSGYTTAMVVTDDITHAFADLFAADNPPNSRCWNCGDDKGTTSICTRPNEGHNYGGFDRDQFLKACGLEPAVCPLCDKPSPDGEVHLDCANYEQALADAQGEAQENLEAAEEIYDSTTKGDS